MNTLQLCRLELAAKYRARARAALDAARVARSNDDGAALRRHLSDARFWRRYAREWCQKARQATPALLRAQAG